MNIIIGIIIAIVGIIIAVYPQPQTSEETPYVIIHENQITDGDKITSKEWKTILPLNPHPRFYEMISIVDGERKLVGAWDTVRGVGLYFPEYKEHFKTPSITN